jgi:hypothetical protein
MKYLVLMLGLLVMGYNVFGQDNYKLKYKVYITQEIFPGPNPLLKYKVSGKHFRILRTKKILKGNFNFTDEIYYCKLNRTSLDSMNLIINKIDFSKFNPSYTSATLDGVAWDFIINSNSGTKKISLLNYYIPEFGLLLDFLNRQLPKEKRYISFDIFGLRNIETK